MSDYEGGDYDEYSNEAAREAGRKQRRVENVVSDIQNERPVVTSTGKVITPPRPGHGDVVAAVIEMVLLIVIVGLSSASIQKLREYRDAGSTAPCFLAANADFRLMIGVVVVSTVAFVRALLILILSLIKKLPALRYPLMLCLVPHCLVLIILSAIMLGWGHPFPSVTAGVISNPDSGTVCKDVDPFRLVHVTAAVTLAFSGWLFLFTPVMALFACYNDIVNNPKVVQARQVLMEEGRAQARKMDRERGNEPAAEFAVKKGRAKAREAARAADSEVSSALDEES